METPGRHPGAAPRAGVAGRAVDWSRTSARRASAWTVGARETHRSVDVGFRLADRDKRVAAGVLAGGVAYRLFFWVLSVSVLATGAFGLVRGEWLDKTLAQLGVGRATAEALRDLAPASEPARWWVLLVGALLVLWTGYLGAKALILVHAAVWMVPAPPARKPWLVSLLFTGTVVALLASMGFVARLHAGGDGLSIVVDLVSTVIPFTMWLLVSRWLPHRGSGWSPLVPGALLVAVGMQAFYLFTTWFLAPKLASATQLYGLVGIAATVLFWLYVLGRLTIGAATLNASLHEHRSSGTVTSDDPA